MYNEDKVIFFWSVRSVESKRDRACNVDSNKTEITTALSALKCNFILRGGGGGGGGALLNFPLADPEQFGAHLPRVCEERSALDQQEESSVMRRHSCDKHEGDVPEFVAKEKI